MVENGKSPEKEKIEEPEIKEEVNHNTTNDTSREESKETVPKEDKTEDEGQKSRSASPAKWVYKVFFFFFNKINTCYILEKI